MSLRPCCGVYKKSVLMKRLKFVLCDIYKNNQKFEDGIIDFTRDKTELVVDQILDKKFNYSTLNNLGRENLNECVQSKDYTRRLSKIIAS